MPKFEVKFVINAPEMDDADVFGEVATMLKDWAGSDASQLSVKESFEHDPYRTFGDE